jgi:Zn-dependent protease with chaperone function
VSLAVCLLGYSLAVAVFGPDALRRATGNGSTPRMGILVWSLAIGSVLLAWVAAAGLITAELIVARGDLGRVLAGCVAALRAAATGELGTAVQAGLLVLATVVAAGLVVLIARLARALHRSRHHTMRHADTARLIGRVDHGLGAVVVEAADRVVYAAAGRPHTIVVSQAALNALDDAQLRAVLAHERAHLAGRHHLLLGVARALAATMPRVRLFAVGSEELGRLVEMCADDAAARRHDKRTLVGALLALAGGPALPGGALAAADTAVVDRAERLLFPPGPEHIRTARLRLGLVMVGLLSGPALAVALAAARSGVCDTVFWL